MSTFGQLGDSAITSVVRIPDLSEHASLESTASLEHPQKGALLMLTEEGVAVSESEMRDQFIVFQFSSKDTGPRVLETSEVTPSIAGSEDLPDAKARLELTSFHIGKDEDVKKDTKATLRIDFGKDKNSSSPLETVFWSIAAGLELYDEIKKDTAQAKDLKSDFSKAFARRPVEIPGGLGQIRFEVVKHKEPPWWRKVFSFLQSGTGRALTSAIGFPGITAEGIRFVDELVGRLDDSKPEVLFRSRPMTLALTQKAKDEFTGGIPGVEVGAINSGFSLLARGRDYKTLVEHDPVYMAAYGLLRPGAVSIADFLGGSYEDPFQDMTYAVLRTKIVAAELEFTW